MIRQNTLKIGDSLHSHGRFSQAWSQILLDLLLFYLHAHYYYPHAEEVATYSISIITHMYKINPMGLCLIR